MEASSIFSPTVRFFFAIVPPVISFFTPLTPSTSLRRAALLGNRFERCQRIEAFAGEHHAGAVGDGGEIAQHHAEAVIERHRNAQTIFGRQPHRLADEEAIVENIMVRQRRALGKAGGARGELNVDRLVELQ